VININDNDNMYYGALTACGFYTLHCSIVFAVCSYEPSPAAMLQTLKTNAAAQRGNRLRQGAKKK